VALIMHKPMYVEMSVAVLRSVQSCGDFRPHGQCWYLSLMIQITRGLIQALIDK
jgi:hypothetical protein